MPTIYHVCLEPIEQRYTKQWYDNIPTQLMDAVTRYGKEDEGWDIVTVEGHNIPDQTTPGAFLDFGATNVYKGSQVAEVSKLFSENKVKPGDKFLITDFWHFGITAIKYMSELLDVPVEIHAIAHAGAYDPSDILGMKMSRPWPNEQERAWFYACDYVYFATEFHRQLFLKNLGIDEQYYHKAIVDGQPDQFIKELAPLQENKKENIIVFTHRVNADKQPEIFRDLVTHLPDGWRHVITQENKYSKKEYYDLLGKCKISFSCALHENLGIGMIESVMAGAIPVLPNRCSYSEIYLDEFKYPTEWTASYEAYEAHKDKLIAFINNIIENYDTLKNLHKEQIVRFDKFIEPNLMYKNLLTLM